MSLHKLINLCLFWTLSCSVFARELPRDWFYWSEVSPDLRADLNLNGSFLSAYNHRDMMFEIFLKNCDAPCEHLTTVVKFLENGTAPYSDTLKQVPLLFAETVFDVGGLRGATQEIKNNEMQRLKNLSLGRPSSQAQLVYLARLSYLLYSAKALTLSRSSEKAIMESSALAEFLEALWLDLLPQAVNAPEGSATATTRVQLNLLRLVEASRLIIGDMQFQVRNGNIKNPEVVQRVESWFPKFLETYFTLSKNLSNPRVRLEISKTFIPFILNLGPLNYRNLYQRISNLCTFHFRDVPGLHAYLKLMKSENDHPRSF